MGVGTFSAVSPPHPSPLRPQGRRWRCGSCSDLLTGERRGSCATRYCRRSVGPHDYQRQLTLRAPAACKASRQREEGARNSHRSERHRRAGLTRRAFGNGRLRRRHQLPEAALPRRDQSGTTARIKPEQRAEAIDALEAKLVLVRSVTAITFESMRKSRGISNAGLAMIAFRALIMSERAYSTPTVHRRMRSFSRKSEPASSPSR